jgi:hypothetical protein
MAVILGGLTTVSVQFTGQGIVTDGIQSINWNVNRQPNRLWELGNFNPFRTQVSKTLTVSLTTYAARPTAASSVDGNLIQPVTLTPSTSCVDSTAKAHIIIDVAACDTIAAISINEEDMFLTSYSYSKGDPVGFGTESWSFQAWLASDVTGSEFIDVGAPSFILQGRTDGSVSGDVGTTFEHMGVLMEADGQVTGQQGSVSAGFPGIGNSDETTLGLINRVGGGTLEASGEVGQSSANIPHNPIYIG